MDKILVVSNKVLEMDHEGTKVVSRLNLAWMRDKEHARSTLSKIDIPVFLDFPHGRSKPPRPNMTLSEAIDLMNEFEKVRFFAISNVEQHEDMKDLRARMPDRVELVPKIETKRGVKNLKSIVAGALTRYIMLDKEDLYNDVDKDVDMFEMLIEHARMAARDVDCHVLELQGVVFS